MSYYLVPAPLIPGDQLYQSLSVYDNVQIRGTLEILDDFIYPTTNSTVGQLIVPKITATSATITNISTGTVGVINVGTVIGLAGNFGLLNATTTIGSVGSFGLLSATTGLISYFSVGNTINVNTTGVTFFNVANALTSAGFAYGSATGYAAVGGTNVQTLDTFTGNIGSAAFTISDIVNALKRAGLLEN